MYNYFTNFNKKIKNFKDILLDNINIINNTITKRNRKIDIKDIIYGSIYKTINYLTIFDLNIKILSFLYEPFSIFLYLSFLILFNTSIILFFNSTPNGP